ncbi:MAG: OPT/YSL family transporter, partial [Polyangiales bacterium]
MPDPSRPNPDDPEARWLAETYRPGERQLTVRAVIAGMLLGGVMCVSNLYVFFKTGWSMGVTITAAILAYALFRGLSAVGLAKRPLGLLENNALITVSSGAGYMTGGGNMAAYGALLMIPFVAPPTLHMVAWFAAIAALGVFCAIPIKRQLINREGLVFPTGTATAETLRVIHGDERAVASIAAVRADDRVASALGTTSSRSHSSSSAGASASGGASAGPGAGASSSSGSRQAQALGIAAGFAALLAWFREAKAAWMP